MIANLDSPVRKSIEAAPIVVKPYMITENDLKEIGHAKCSITTGRCSTKVPTWLVSGRAACDRHLSPLIQDVRDANEWRGYWLTAA
ncbi:hypothetical protein ACFYYS_06265 [Streptomyces sp. NPDC002120]|uniref:hypothetical protein n=1 Tax=Streptomyces sp. NPDC002120 TaxID=3364631 RepID=UPI0036833B04